MILPVDPARYLAFLGAMAILAATPGPSNLFAVANGMSRGRKAVFLGVAGMNTATLLWYAGAALGLSALALAFPQAVKALIVVGALYLLWLAFQALKTASPRTADSATPHPHRALGLLGRVHGADRQPQDPAVLRRGAAAVPGFQAAPGGAVRPVRGGDGACWT